MTTEKTKSTRKRIKTTLTVKLMESKTRRDMYREFLKDKVPKGFDEKSIETIVSLNGEYVNYGLYKMFSGIGASREFLESFKFTYINKYKHIDSSKLADSIYEVVPFITISGVNSTIQSYTLGSDNLDCSNDIKLEIETYSWRSHITADDVKNINKENARKLRHYLVSLPSVQGVPYTCTFREDEVVEQECSV